MKNVIRHGLAASLAGALALLGSTQAQQGASGGTPSSDTASGGAGASASSGSTVSGAPSAGQKLDKGLQDELEKIHATNQAEVQLAQLAAADAQFPEVKEFAQQMRSDHKQMDQQLSQQGQTLGVSLEGKTFQKEQQGASKELEKLQSRTGKDFDKAFMSTMVKGHQQALKNVGSAVKSAQKAKLTELAAALQTAQAQVQGHLDHAKQVQKSLDQSAKAQGTASSGKTQGTRSSGTGSSGTSGTSTSPSAQPGGTGTKPPSQ
jgi:putative membrane protein